MFGQTQPVPGHSSWLMECPLPGRGSLGPPRRGQIEGAEHQGGRRGTGSAVDRSVDADPSQLGSFRPCWLCPGLFTPQPPFQSQLSCGFSLITHPLARVTRISLRTQSESLPLHPCLLSRGLPQILSEVRDPSGRALVFKHSERCLADFASAWLNPRGGERDILQFLRLKAAASLSRFSPLGFRK